MQFSSVLALSSVALAASTQITSTAVAVEKVTVVHTITSCSNEACVTTTSHAISTATITETASDEIVFATTTVKPASEGVTFIDVTTTPTVTVSTAASTDITITPTIYTTLVNGNHSNYSSSFTLSTFAGQANGLNAGLAAGVAGAIAIAALF